MQQSPELKNLYVRLCEASAAGDTAFIEQAFSRQAGTIAIGPDSAEWWSGYDTVIRIWKAQMETMGGGMPMVAGDPQAYQEGSVGWVADQPHFQLPSGKSSFRMTCVFHQEDGTWKVVHAHASVGMPNEETIGTDLPT